MRHDVPFSTAIKPPQHPWETHNIAHMSDEYPPASHSATTRKSPSRYDAGLGGDLANSIASNLISPSVEDPEGYDSLTTRTTRQAGLRGKIATDQSNTEYFDTVSSVSFTSLILSTLSLSDTDIVAAMSRNASEAYDEPRQQHESSFWDEIDHTTWPEPRIATDLFNHYFAHTHQIYPILHEGTIRQTYIEFYNEILRRRMLESTTELRPKRTDRVAVALFEVMFAMVETHIGRMGPQHESPRCEHDLVSSDGVFRSSLVTSLAPLSHRSSSAHLPNALRMATVSCKRHVTAFAASMLPSYLRYRMLMLHLLWRLVQVLLLTTLLMHASDPGDACLCYDLVGGQFGNLFLSVKETV